MTPHSGRRPGLSVDAEETITTFASPNNGSGPLWNGGSPMMVRLGDRVLVSIPETGAGVPPLCNTRWQLWRRDSQGWSVQQSQLEYREREPCPLAYRGGGRLLLSANSSIDATVAQTEFMGQPTPEMQYCIPHLLEFDASRPAERPVTHLPRWSGPMTLKDHSYRGLASDPQTGEVLVFNKTRDNMDYAWSFMDGSGRWVNYGRTGTPINACYPVLALRGRAAHMTTIGDIIEPVKEWLDYKWEHQKSRFFFVFRRIFYTWTPDVSREQFCPPLELDSVEETAGHMYNYDLWLAPDGQVHELHYARSIASELMRDRFFPGQPIVHSLTHCIIRDGEVVHRETLATATEGDSSDSPRWARFHATAPARLCVVGGFVQPDGGWTNRVLELLPKRGDEWIALPLRAPFSQGFTATERGGSEPSLTLDLYGVADDPNQLRYARVLIQGHSSLPVGGHSRAVP